MGYFYIGGKTNQKTNGYLKIGETNQKYLSQRVGHIRMHEGNFVVFKYLEIPDSTLSMTRAIEGHVRLMLEWGGWHQVQNDHFTCAITPETRDEIYQKFTEEAVRYACEYCDMTGIKYTVKKAKENARKNHRPREKRA